MTRFVLLCSLAGVLASGCSFVSSDGLHLDYSFSPLDFQQKLDTAAGTLPDVPCGSGGIDCAAVVAAYGDPNITGRCGATSTCEATVTMRLAYTINLAEQSGFPEEALQYGVRAATLTKVAYWLTKNSLTVAVPPIDLYVAPETAVDETDARARLLGTVASVPAASDKCADAIDTNGDSAAPQDAQVCRVPLNDEGRAALQSFAADYKTPFKLLVHATATFGAGSPIPSGTLGFSVRPTVGLAIATTL